MKCSRIEGLDKFLFPQNLERVDESAIFSRVLQKLESAGANIDNPEMLPEGDMAKGLLSGKAFIVFNDIFDGVDIQADDTEILNEIQRILETD